MTATLISNLDELPSLEDLQTWDVPLPKPEAFKTTLIEMSAPRVLNFDSFLWRKVKEPTKFLRKVGEYKEDLTREMELAATKGKDFHPIIQANLSNFLVLDWDVEDTSRIEELASSAVLVTTPSGKKKALFHVQIHGPKRAKDLEEYLKLILKKCRFECKFDSRLSAMTVFFLSKETFENPPRVIPKTFLFYKNIPTSRLEHEWSMPTEYKELDSLMETFEATPKQRREMVKVCLFMLGSSNFLKGADLPQDYMVKTFKRVFPNEVSHQPYVSDAIRLLRKYHQIQCIEKSTLNKAKTYRAIREFGEILRNLPKTELLSAPEKMKIKNGRWHDELGKLVYRFQSEEDYLEYCKRIPGIEKKDRWNQAVSWSRKLGPR
jgi:hypothetical protein